MPRKFTDLQLACAVATSTTIREVCHQLGIVGAGANYKTIRRRIRELDLDISHFKWRRTRGRLPPISDEALRAAIANSKSYAGTIRRLDLPLSGWLLNVIKDRIQSGDIDISHFTGQGWSKGKKMPFRPLIPIEELLRAGRPYTSSELKKRLLIEGFKLHRCERCRQSEWFDNPIPLELDHVNGDSDDNRLENLRLLCPNCHALTDNYRGRNIGRRL